MKTHIATSLSALLGGLTLYATPPAVSNSSLIDAIRNGDRKAIGRLIEKRENVNARDARGNTALHLAALNLDVDTMARLLKAGADPNATNVWGDTPLIYSAGDLAKVKLLLEHHADVNARATNGATALSAAGAFSNSLEVVRYLLDHGAKTGSKAPLEIQSAILGGNVETVRLLLDHGALATTDSPNPLDSPLVTASVVGDDPIVRALIVHAGNPAAKSMMLNAAFQVAGLGEKTSAERTFALNGADLHARFAIGGITPLHWAAYNERDDPGLAQLLLARGADVNALDEDSETALDWAIKRGHRKIIATLTAAGGKPGHRRIKSKRVPNRAIPAAGVERDRMIRQSIEHSLALLEKSSDVFLESGLARMESCVSCHHQMLTEIAGSWARARGIRSDTASLKRILDATLGRWIGPNLAKGYEGMLPNPNPPIGSGYALLELKALGYPADDFTDSIVWQLAASQEPDGHWRVFSSRPPLEHGLIKSTALALNALQNYPIPARIREFRERIERAKNWLEGAKAESPTELAFQLLGLGWAGEKPSAIKQFTDAILAAQKSDGGWASLENLESDAWMTGLNLVALHEAGGVKASDPAYQLGVEFLLRTQFDDGSWWVRSRTMPVQPHFDSQFPHGLDQWISAAGTGWATMALLLAIEPMPHQPTLREEMAALPNKPVMPALAQDSRAWIAAAAPAVSFKKEIEPILERSCTDCHSGEHPKGSLDAESRAGLLKGGQSGNPAIQPGHADTSPLVRFTSDLVEDLEMPPLNKRSKYPALTQKEINLIRLWIDQGAIAEEASARPTSNR